MSTGIQGTTGVLPAKLELDAVEELTVIHLVQEATILQQGQQVAAQ
jgi:hypothetical protein